MATMFKQLIVLGLKSGTIYRVDTADGAVTTLYDKGGPVPDGVVIEDGIVYWTTMGTPTPDPSADDGFDFSAPTAACTRCGSTAPAPAPCSRPGGSPPV